MRIAQVEFLDFRGLKTGQVTLPLHGVLLGGNNVGKTAVVESIAQRFPQHDERWSRYDEGFPDSDKDVTVLANSRSLAKPDILPRQNHFSHNLLTGLSKTLHRGSV